MLLSCSNSEATDSVDSLASDEDVSVGDEEDGSLRIDWEGVLLRSLRVRDGRYSEPL